MDRNEAQDIVKNFDLIKAFADGEQIQYQSENLDWEDITNPSFNINDYTVKINYRIKPKEQYTPFTNKDSLIGLIITNPTAIDTNNKKYMIINQNDSGIEYLGHDCTMFVSYQDLMNRFIFFTSGVKCGNKV
jgi:hypothetical protein